ncbi:MAG: 2-succinyl-5-enolpyruvyl-6-hydroxy-3-cyclohexene-1-carboxylic-acid synthase, partial [Actinomycetota bacterium]|nr:2-succinyl-5-enolpyruvyl-6-hydroxy-3-cyclohexene-1-carboxylic-acid synthase [Actinomycetota bacterium]
SLIRDRRIKCWSHIDERCAGFFALGAAKAQAKPVALTCTSGTAAANLSPAVIEAHHAHVPLIVLTADRPPEMRQVGAGQTIDQVKLYGGAVKWFFEVGVHDASPDELRWIRMLACRAYGTAVADLPGPVHLNFPLREPLVIDGELPPERVPGRAGGRPWVSGWSPTSASADTDTGSVALPARGAVVAGGEVPGGDQARAAMRLAERAGYPLLADPLSGARRGSTAIARYDMLLRDPGFAARMAPELVIRVGALPTSKSLRSWLAGTSARQVSLGLEAAWQDPAAVVEAIGPADALNALQDSGLPSVEPGWLSGWQHADRGAEQALVAELGSALSEPMVAMRLGDWLGPEVTLFVASSMPVRDLELFLGAGEDLPRVLANRGANGIDGTVSSAFGAAAAGAGPVVLLIGDVALLHDLGGLLAAHRLGLQVTIVVLNNDGGGIFHFLPIAAEAEAFEQHVATPHGRDFSVAANLYGCQYRRAQTEPELRTALDEAVAGAVTTILEVRTDRRENLELHRRLQRAALAAVRAGS